MISIKFNVFHVSMEFLNILKFSNCFKWSKQDKNRQKWLFLPIFPQANPRKYFFEKNFFSNSCTTYFEYFCQISSHFLGKFKRYWLMLLTGKRLLHSNSLHPGALGPPIPDPLEAKSPLKTLFTSSFHKLEMFKQHENRIKY